MTIPDQCDTCAEPFPEVASETGDRECRPCEVLRLEAEDVLWRERNPRIARELDRDQ